MKRAFVWDSDDLVIDTVTYDDVVQYHNNVEQLNLVYDRYMDLYIVIPAKYSTIHTETSNFIFIANENALVLHHKDFYSVIDCSYFNNYISAVPSYNASLDCFEFVYYSETYNGCIKSSFRVFVYPCTRREFKMGLVGLGDKADELRKILY